MTLFLPWLDAAKSYRPVVNQFETALHPNTLQRLQSGQDCLFIDAKSNLSAILAWQVYSKVNINTQDAHTCQYHLLNRKADDAQVAGGWQILWQGHRPREDYEHFILVHKQQFDALF